MRRHLMGNSETVLLKAGTKASELPDWVTKEKPIDANGDEVDEPLLGEHVWIDEPELAPRPRASRPRGITLTGGMFSADGAFTPFATEQLFTEGAA